MFLHFGTSPDCNGLTAVRRDGRNDCPLTYKIVIGDDTKAAARQSPNCIQQSHKRPPINSLFAYFSSHIYPLIFSSISL